MTNLNLIVNEKTDQARIRFKTTEKKREDTTRPFLTYRNKPFKYRRREFQYDLSEILSQPAIPIELNIQTRSIQTTQNVSTENVNEQLIWKIEAQLSAL